MTLDFGMILQVVTLVTGIAGVVFGMMESVEHDRYVQTKLRATSSALSLAR